MILTKIAITAVGFILSAILALNACPPVPVSKYDGSADKSREAVDAWLRAINKGDALQPQPKIAPVNDKVRSLFPGDYFYTVQFMRFPRAVKPPGSLKLENIVRVRPDASVDRIEDLDALRKLFETKLTEARDETQVRVVLLACLQLTQEFYQDGYYSFTIPIGAISITQKDDRFVATGKAVVSKGGQGEVTVTLTTGKPSKVEIEGKVRPDVRLR